MMKMWSQPYAVQLSKMMKLIPMYQALKKWLLNNEAWAVKFSAFTTVVSIDGVIFIRQHSWKVLPSIPS